MKAIKVDKVTSSQRKHKCNWKFRLFY